MQCCEGVGHLPDPAAGCTGARVAATVEEVLRVDPPRIGDSHHFAPPRENPAHLAFGAGRQFCLDAAKARPELQIALGALFERCPRMRVIDTPRYAGSYHFHGLERRASTGHRNAAPHAIWRRGSHHQGPQK